ncbi:cytochrome P450 [Irpex rosettiformis]|uniref:Cytochrome P450 n=1 Tax=Irpex rosettiformis TaxID=378272 RepID=A0ACB8UDK4_9APHY|nr:cytochrome P450 [Irpex rosettiformis]
MIPSAANSFRGYVEWSSAQAIPALSSVLHPLKVYPFQACVAIGWAILAVVTVSRMLRPHRKQWRPPVIPYWIPYLGSALQYGKDPIGFLNKCKEQHGNVFTFVMIGRRFTVALGPYGTHFVMSGQSNAISAGQAQTALTTPVFGEGVMYDAPMDYFTEQKRFITSIMDSERFNLYVPIVEEEVLQVFRNDPSFTTGSIDALGILSKVILRTLTATLQGPDAAARITGTHFPVFMDLLGGFTPLHWMFKGLPLPSYRKRDIAHAKMRQMFLDIIQERRLNGMMNEKNDLLAELVDQQYRDGNPVTDTDIAHLMIATLVVGYQTSAFAATWILLHIADEPSIAELLYEEQQVHYMNNDGSWRPLAYSGLLKLPILRSVIRETFRVNPPVSTVVRLVTEDLVLPTSIGTDPSGSPLLVPKGDFIMTSNGVSQLDADAWKDPLKWDPLRWLNVDEKIAVTANQTSYQPFGTGKHRCSGELFAILELSVVVSTFIRHYELRLPGSLPASDYSRVHIAPLSSEILIFPRTKVQNSG